MNRIMIVDDEFLVRIGIKSMVDWEARGYEIVAEAVNGEDAIAKISTVHPHIILTDLVMEPGDGLSLIAHCREHYPDIPCVVLSNYNDFEKVKAAMKLGAKDYFFKLTADPEELLSMLDGISHELRNKKIPHHEAEALLTRNAGAIRNRVLRLLMEEEQVDEAELLQELRLAGSRCDFTLPYRLLLLRLADAPLPSQGENLLSVSLENLVAELLVDMPRAQTFRYEQSLCVVALNPDDTAEAGFAREMDALFIRMDAYVRRYLDLGLLGGLSGLHQGLPAFRQAIQDGRRALAHCYMQRANRLSRDTRPPAEATPPHWPENATVSGLQTALACARFDLARAELHTLFDALYAQPDAQVEAVREGLYQRYTMLKADGQSKGVSSDILADEKGLPLSQAILRGDRLETAERCFFAALESYEHTLNTGGYHRLKREIAEVVAHVQHSLTGDLSIATVAKLVHMSESYFSRLFKNEMGTGFVDYVNGIRIAKAKELLRTTDLRINEVAADVGIDNPNYFSILFKKQVGIPPGEFRSRNME